MATVISRKAFKKSSSLAVDIKTTEALPSQLQAGRGKHEAHSAPRLGRRGRHRAVGPDHVFVAGYWGGVDRQRHLGRGPRWMHPERERPRS